MNISNQNRNELGRAVSPLTDVPSVLSDCPRDSLRVLDRGSGTDGPVGEGGSWGGGPTGLAASNKKPGDNDKLAREPRCRITGVPGGMRIVLKGVKFVGRFTL